MKKFRFGKYGALSWLDDREEFYELDDAHRYWVMKDQWKFVWWWPLNWVVLPIATIVAIFLVAKQSQKDKGDE